jgi:DNA-binding NarL/FixJ family response regulator
MTVTAVVDDPEVAVQVVMAAVRGADLVIEVRLAGADRLAFLDELNRVGTVPVDGSPTVGRLSPEQFALLDGLARGRSLTEMCRELGLSRRTATRRLADARARLGVSTTVEAAVRRESARRPRSG